MQSELICALTETAKISDHSVQIEVFKIKSGHCCHLLYLKLLGQC